MAWENRYLRFIFLIQFVAADLCPEPTVPNGVVRGEKEQNLFFGVVTCNVGYHLVGSKTIKCRHGDWSQKELPVCSAIGACPSLPEVHNGRNIPIQGSRGSAYRFKCNRGFKRFGEPRTHCIGDRWSHSHMPSCTKRTCDVTGMLDIPYGEGRAMMGGAVFKYRCNQGIEMEGSNTLVCDGENWNGTVPHCNVGPSEPELEVIISGTVVSSVNPGDWVLVTCQAKGGHPLPDIGLTLDGTPTGSKDFRNFKNSFTFTASEENNGQVILCSAFNKAGTSATSTVLHVLSPPLKAEIIGPKTIHPNNDYAYECSVDGGNPTPEISWNVMDHLGKSKVMKGEMMGSGLSRMSLRTSSDDRMLSITCLGENTEGVVSHTTHVNTNYLPKSVEITGPVSVQAGEYAHFNCFSTESFPVPALTWTVEKFGNVYEVDNIEGDVSTDALADGGVIAFAKLDILFEPGTTDASVQCSGMLEGLGETHSKDHEIEIISIELPDLKTKENNDMFIDDEAILSDYSEEDENMYDHPEEDENMSDHLEEDYDEYDHPQKDLKIVNEKKPAFEEEDRSKSLWIPLHPTEDIQEYQDIFNSFKVDLSKEDEVDFQRPADVLEPTMLKQEKKATPSVDAHSPVFVSTVYSSSTTTFLKTILIVFAVSVPIL